MDVIAEDMSAVVVVEAHRAVVFVSGELDIASTKALDRALEAAESTGAPIAVDCTGITFIDANGVGALLRAIEQQSVRLENVPCRVARVFALVRAEDAVRHRRDAVAIAVCEGSVSADAQALREVFVDANRCGGTYEIVVVSPWSSMNSRALPRRWCSVVVPPIERWMGPPSGPSSGWLSQLAERADHVVGVGTGSLLLACAGLLDEHDVVAAPAYATYLTSHAPAARIRVGVGAVTDGAISTAATCAGGVSLCAEIVERGHLLPTSGVS